MEQYGNPLQTITTNQIFRSPCQIKRMKVKDLIGCWGWGVTFPIDPNICNNHSRVTEGGPTTKPSVAKLAFNHI